MKQLALLFCLSSMLLQATVIQSGSRTEAGFIGNGRSGSSISFNISVLDSTKETYAYTFTNSTDQGLNWVILSLSENCFTSSGALLDSGCAAAFTGNVASLEFGNFSSDLLLGACECATDLPGIHGVKVNFSTTSQTQSITFTSDRDVNSQGNFYALNRSGTWFIDSGANGSLDATAHLPTPDGGLISGSAVSTPEPASALLIAIPLAAFILIRRK